MSAPYYEDDAVTLWHGDCLDVMATLPDASVDAVVTDPPYGLGFMGREWDDLPPGLPWARECLRVLKPGGHLLAFGGSRTWHRLAVAVEDAGFEVRDSIAWLYGSGFPKSLDVSKAIDKAGGDPLAFREFARAYSAAVASSPLTHSDIDRHLGIKASSCYWAREDHRGGMPPRHHWEAARELLDLNDEFERLYDEAERADREIRAGQASGSLSSASVRVINAGTPVTPAAQRWQGWGTALKPAFEPIVVARKPLAGTVAANVLAHGTGALNIDGCRVEASGERFGGGAKGSSGFVDGYQSGAGFVTSTAGRWPTNVVLDGHAADELDAQSGTLKSGKMQPTHTEAGRNTYGQNVAGGYTTMETYGDTGGASRFFPTFRYQAKAPTRERPSYEKPGADGSVAGSPATSGRRCNVCGNQTVPKGGKPWPACGHDDWSRFETENRTAGKVAHPTVKPLELMRWLVRLVTPPGGLVLEPFAGSGTTVEAAILEGFQCIAIEREADYLPLIRARIDRNRHTADGLPAAAEALALFDFEEPA